MDIKTLFLYAAFGIVTFNLWSDWKQEHAVVPPTPSISIAQQTKTLIQSDAPSHQIEVNHDIVHVKTDVLDVQIDLENGDLTNASLINFSNTIQNITQPLTLFQKNYQQQYYAATHFVVLQGQQPKNVAVQYSSPSLSYQLQDNQNQLLVELKGVTRFGYEIRKVYRFDKGSYGDTILVTMHRRENHHWLDEWFNVINQLAIDYPQYKFVLPIHPNPNVQKHKNLLTNINIVEPLTHNETINILKDCKLVVTDSGGLQEEGSFFNKKVIVCRKTTERPEGIKTGHLYMCEEPTKLKELFGELEKNSYICKPCPYGDGRAAEKIKKILDAE